MRSAPVLIVLTGLIFLLDLYIFQIVKTLSVGASPKTRSYLLVGYWVFSLLCLLLLIVLPQLNMPKGPRSIIFAILIALVIAKMVAAIFFLLDDFRRGLQWLAGKTFFRNTEGEQFGEGDKISRSVFMSWLGVAAGSTLFGTLLYGFSNKYDYRVKRVKLSFPNLPAGFKGLKIVQLSDIHSGSLTDKTAVNRGIDKVLSLDPDLILFTGDLVNDQAIEMEPYKEVFARLSAPLGVYSVLGNHDYGDYVEWESVAAKRANLAALIALQKEMGWRLLINEHVLLQRGGDTIALLGIENWGNKGRFPKYGKMHEAYPGTEQVPFKILMSHDPSHWDGEVRPKYGDIDLTLSGHTHGMQFGVELPWLRWSPVQYVYNQWAGLYTSGRQKLYVNRGFGFIGYPGRVGILPEITLIELG